MYIIVLESNFQPPAYLVDLEDYYFAASSAEATEFAPNIVDRIMERYVALHPEYNFSKRKCAK